jgi:hypothetical protein
MAPFPPTGASSRKFCAKRKIISAMLYRARLNRMKIHPSPFKRMGKEMEMGRETAMARRKGKDQAMVMAKGITNNEIRS